ncbi:hypothetical protein ACHAWF_010225 [Thalassiosira exigua]
MRVQPVTLRRLEEFIVLWRQLFEGVLLRDEIPISEIPSCIITQMLDDKDQELDDFRKEMRSNQVKAIYAELEKPEKKGQPNLKTPKSEDVEAAQKSNPLNWDALGSFHRHSRQTVESYKEQHLAIRCGASAIDKYMCQTGRHSMTISKGLITHGAPGTSILWPSITLSERRAIKDFQEIQRITRLSPYLLKKDKRLMKGKFRTLMRKTLTFVDRWDKVDVHVKRMYAQRMPAYEAYNAYVESFREKSRERSIAGDFQHVANSRSEYDIASSRAIISPRLNHGAREPKKLLFWKGALFEATINKDGYNQSQLLIMLDVPSKETIKKKAPIELYAAPPGTSDIDLNDGVPSKSYLRDKEGWNPVQVGPVRDRPITHRGIMGLRRQYALCHTGSNAINKQMGNTIEGKCAVECTEECSPWQKEQVVVCLSRTTKGENTIIVGDPDRAIEHM